jgi:FkbM family methyltransferase
MQLPFAVRSLGHRLLRKRSVRVRSGINRGLRWSLVTSGRGYGSGLFGRDRLETLAKVVRPGDSFWDLGAHKGFVSMAASRMVGPTGAVVSMEPSATNLWFLRAHVAWNGVENVQVIPAAVGAASGTASFGGRGDSLAYRLGQGDEVVDVRTLPDVIEQWHVPPPTVIKMDVEGVEADALRGAGKLLDDVQALLISVHSRELHRECADLLEGRGFALFESWEMAVRTADLGAAWAGDHDLLALGPDRAADLTDIHELSLIAGG